MRHAFAILLVIVISAQAETLYVSQSGSGSGTGADTSNRMSIANLNNTSNWGSGAGKVSAGDTVSLSGTFTTALVVAGSGTSGNPVTILFESGAMFSSPVWTPYAIALFGKDFITIDGGTNGTIKNTANGSTLANQVSDSTAIHAQDGSDNLTVRNLNILDIFISSVMDEPRFEPAGVNNIGGSNMVVENCVMTNCDAFIGYNKSNIIIRNNDISHGNHGISGGVGGGSVDEVISNVQIYGNYIHHLDTWDSDDYHLDGIIIKMEGTGNSYNTGLRIYNNTFGPGIRGNSDSNTAAIYLDGYDNDDYRDVQIYNNLFLTDPGEYWENGFIAGNGLIANNTFIGEGPGVGASDNSTIVNNIFNFNGGYAILLGYFNHPNNVVVDYNVYSSSCQFKDYNNPDADETFSNLAGWQGYGYDAHSVTGVPSLDSSYVPTSTDTLAKDQGTSQSSFFTTDKRGISRPQGPAWDKGAMEFQSGPTPGIQTLNVTNLRIGP